MPSTEAVSSIGSPRKQFGSSTLARRTRDRYSTKCAQISLLQRPCIGYALLMRVVSLCAPAMAPAVRYGPAGLLALGVPASAAHTQGCELF